MTNDEIRMSKESVPDDVVAVQGVRVGAEERWEEDEDDDDDGVAKKNFRFRSWSMVHGSIPFP